MTHPEQSKIFQPSEFFRLGPDDVSRVVALEQACFTMPWSEEQFRAAFNQSSFAAFGLRETQGRTQGGALLGYISLYHALDELEILNIAVAPQSRRQGKGRELLSLALQVARKMGIERAVLEVRVHNVPALRLYEGLGFACVGRRPKYYADTGEDALIYALSLSQ